MKRIALSIVLLYVLAASLSLMSCHSKEVGTDPDDTRPRVLGVDIKQGEFILNPPYVLQKSRFEDITIEVAVYDPQATPNDPQGSGEILRVQGAFEDPDFGNPEYEERVTNFWGSFPGWENTIGSIKALLTRDEYLAGEVFYGLGFEGELLDSGPGMNNAFPDRIAGDGIYTIKKNSRLDPRTKSHATRPWHFYFWATDNEGHSSIPYRFDILITE
ncbi:hypothetical protein J7M28_06675 [bacterium]|nr:hypothetical protein [bacterium]